MVAAAVGLEIRLLAAGRTLTSLDLRLRALMLGAPESVRNDPRVVSAYLGGAEVQLGVKPADGAGVAPEGAGR